MISALGSPGPAATAGVPTCGQPHWLGRRCLRDARANLLPHRSLRLDRGDQHVQLAEPALPARHLRRELRIDQQHGVGLRALVGVERAERVFCRDAFAFFVHRHDPRHSRISSRLRRSQVLIVFVGASNFAASWSRLQPL
jgi:hypothetical protein